MEALSIPQGRNIGTILEFLLEAVLDDQNLNERGRLLELARNFYEERLRV